MTLSIIISIIALAFSGASLGWSIYQYYDKKKGKLKIKFKYLTPAYNNEVLEFGFIVTNISQAIVMVDNYEFYLDLMPKNHIAFAELINIIKTPIKIEVGAQ